MPYDFNNPHAEHPTSLLINRPYCEGLCVYVQGSGISVVVTSTQIEVTTSAFLVTVPYVGRTIDEVSQRLASANRSITANPLIQSPILSENELFVEAGELSADGGYVIRFRGHMLRYTEDTRIRCLLPYDEGRLLPWYPRVDRGNVVLNKDGVRYIFAVPDYGLQEWSPYFGPPFVDVVGERAIHVGAKQLQVARTPILWRNHNIAILINGAPSVGPSLIEDVDENNGWIFLSQAIQPEDTISISYTYREETHVYRDVNLNPTIENNPGLLDQTVVLYLLPAESSLGRKRSSCVRHMIARTIVGAIESIPRTDEPVLVIGAYQIRAAGNIEDVLIRDIRSRGGGISMAQYDQALARTVQAHSVTDAGRWDGVPFPGSAAGILKLPRSLLAAYGQKVVEQKVKKHLALGGNLIVEYDDTL